MSSGETIDQDSTGQQRTGTSPLVIAVHAGVFLTAAICSVDFARDTVLATFPGPATLIWLAAIFFPTWNRLPPEQSD